MRPVGQQTPAPLSEDDALTLLREAEFSASRLIPWGSNYSFAVAMEAPDGRTQLAIYKPQAGKRHSTTSRTARSTSENWPPISSAAGQAGTSCRRPSSAMDRMAKAAFSSTSSRRATEENDFWGSRHPDVERLVLFDHLVNNADRKISHCLRDPREGLGDRSRPDVQWRAETADGALAIRRRADLAAAARASSRLQDRARRAARHAGDVIAPARSRRCCGASQASRSTVATPCSARGETSRMVGGKRAPCLLG